MSDVVAPEKTKKGLPDLQNQEDKRGVAIDRVGIEGIYFPIKIKMKPEEENKQPKSVMVSALVNLFVGLPKNYKGANMSRFMTSLLEFQEVHTILSSTTMPQLLSILRDKMKAKDAFARFEFDYFINVKAPVSKLEAPQRYRCAFTGIKNNGDYDFILEVNVVAASVCPCSREMSLLDNLEYDDIKWKIGEDNKGYEDLTKKTFFDASQIELSQQVGMGAHNQRSNIRVEVVSKENEIIWIEDLIGIIEAQASCPVYPILKRPDEKFVTEFAYQHAKFSEDITRDIHIALEKLDTIESWNLKVSNQESIHLYNAVCHNKSSNWRFHT
jgi:GTP cyclohydrolase I